MNLVFRRAAWRPALMVLLLALLLPACATRQAPAQQPAASPPAAVDTVPDEVLQLQSGARAGDPNSQLLLAEKLLSGDGIPRDPEQARAWLEKAVAADFAPALDLLATLYYRGVGMPIDYGHARRLMESAVAHSYLPAINNLGWLLATCPDDALRDGAAAIALLTPNMDSSPQMLDTLAAAYAETGDFEQALQLQQRAITALGDVRDRNFGPFVARLKSYSEHRPWRDPPPP